MTGLTPALESVREHLRAALAALDAAPVVLDLTTLRAHVTAAWYESKRAIDAAEALATDAPMAERRSDGRPPTAPPSPAEVLDRVAHAALEAARQGHPIRVASRRCGEVTKAGSRCLNASLMFSVRPVCSNHATALEVQENRRTRVEYVAMLRELNELLAFGRE